MSPSAAPPDRVRRAGAEPPALLLYRDGSIRSEPLSADEQVRLWAGVVHGGAGGLVEFVAATRHADGSLVMRARRDPANYPTAGDADALAALAAAANGRGKEAFCSVLARPVPEPGKKAVAAGRVVWVDVDRVGGEEELGWLDVLRPHLWVASGGGIHCYWRLDREVDAETLESCNRRLAHAVRGDPACTDRGRIMRLPGTLNRKRGRRCRIVRLELTRPAVDPDRLRERLPDPEPWRPPRPTVRRLIGGGADELALTPPPAYFQALAGVGVPERGGYVHCPLPGHEERTASCHVWPDPERGWWCFGCNRGGGIYDLASALQGGPTGAMLRGSAFSAARERVRESLD
jgi:RepB DNA-primase from phage plasmid